MKVDESDAPHRCGWGCDSSGGVEIHVYACCYRVPVVRLQCLENAFSFQKSVCLNLSGKERLQQQTGLQIHGLAMGIYATPMACPKSVAALRAPP